MAEICGLPKRLLQQTLYKMANDILHHLETIIAMVETDNSAELDYLERYRDDVERRCRHFQEQAARSWSVINPTQKIPSRPTARGGRVKS